MRVIKFLCAALIGICFNLFIVKAQNRVNPKYPVIDFRYLLGEMLNRADLAKYPAGSWTLHHVSSYDRSSIARNKPGWFANKDWDNYIRKEINNGVIEYVLMDAEGPGVITHFWVAGHPNQKAHLRFYIDGQRTPFWEADHTGALIGQNTEIGAPLSQRSVDQDYLTINPGAQPGHNLYAPIPFKHHIKVTYDKAPGEADSGFWYNIDYRIYNSDVNVTSFSAQTPRKCASLLHWINEVFNNFMAKSAKTAAVGGEKSTKRTLFDLTPGATKSINLQGTGSVRSIFLSLQGKSRDNAVSKLVVQIEFDGKVTVNVPAGFFFGCGDQLVESANWYSKVDTDGTMANYWVMPYHHSAIIRLVNQGSERINGFIKVACGDWKWDNKSMYFHAMFKKMQNYMTVAQKGTDFNYIDLENRAGVYVGDILQVNKSVGGWWGEGDEKIYIDGSKFPDDFGTGSEDYYGYAWGHPETFNHIFNSQPMGNANLTNKGGTTINSRERNLDALPFKKSLRFDMESWNWFGGPVNYAWACFWYEK